MSTQWLSSKAPGFQALKERERAAIFDFIFLWSLFEAKVLDHDGSAHSICKKVSEWRDAGTLAREQHEPQLDYFRKRYFADGKFTHHFDHLCLRKSDKPNILRSVLDGSNNDPRDCVLTVILIVWRFRNNLFHGQKWDYQLADQLSNFTHANAVLVRLLERHGQLPAEEHR